MTETDETSDASPTELFLTTLLRMLRPITRAMIANGVTVGEATETLKHALVLSAAIGSDKDGKRLSDSRVSLKTGLHRKDVRRLRADVPSPPRRPKLNAAALTIGVWSSSKSFTDEKGQPRALERPEFNELVRSARVDLPPATILTELLSQGLVVEGEKDKFSLQKKAYVGIDDSADILVAFEKNIVAHLEAATDNLIDNTGHFERAGHFNQLSEASIAELEEESRAAFQEALERIAAKALLLQDADALQEEPAQGRFTAGAYVLPAKGKSE